MTVTDNARADLASRRPRTRVRISPAGRKAFAAYLEALGRLIGPQG